MSVTATHYVGADVAKDTIAFCGLKTATIKNAQDELDAYAVGLPAGAHVICEATGRHHHLLAKVCGAHDVPLTVLNPTHARNYARSLGKLEKTDALDAAILRRFGVERRPVATPVPDEARQELLDLLMVRSAVVADITEHRCRDALLSAASSKHQRAIIAVLKTRQKAVEKSLSDWLESPVADKIRQRVQTLCLVPGVGVLSALQITANLPELGQCNRRQIAKLAGLAPLPWDSGQMHGLRRIQGGRAPARRVLYQCAVVAARWNENLRPHYQQLRARGLPAKSAYCVIARKLLVFLNAALRPTPADAL